MRRRETVNEAGFNPHAILPFELRLKDFELAMQDVYDFFHDVNHLLLAKGLHRLDDMLRPAAMSGIISDMLTHGSSWKTTISTAIPISLCEDATPTTPSLLETMALKSKAHESRAALSTPTAPAISGCASLFTQRTIAPSRQKIASR